MNFLLYSLWCVRPTLTCLHLERQHQSQSDFGEAMGEEVDTEVCLSVEAANIFFLGLKKGQCVHDI